MHVIVQELYTDSDSDSDSNSDGSSVSDISAAHNPLDHTHASHTQVVISHNIIRYIELLFVSMFLYWLYLMGAV